MANPRKRKMAKLAVLALEQTDATDVAGQSQEIVNGNSALGADGQSAARELARSALRALAVDDTGNINPDTSVSRRGSLKFVAGESRVMLDDDALVCSTYTETAVPHYVMADGSSAEGDSSGVVFDNSFDSLNIPALFAPIGRDGGGDVVFTLDLSDQAIAAQGNTAVTLTYHNSLRIISDDAGDDGYATDGTAHDIVSGAGGANLSHALNIERSSGIGEANALLASQIKVRLGMNQEGGGGNEWAQGDVVRITTASGRIWDFTATDNTAVAADYEFDVTGANITAVMNSLEAAIDASPALDMLPDGTAPADGVGGNSAHASGDILIEDVMGQGTDDGVSLEVLRSDTRLLQAEGVGVYATGAALAEDGLAPGADGGGRGAGNFTVTLVDTDGQNCAAMTVDGDGAVAGAAAGAVAGGADSSTATIQLDEFPVRIRYNAPALNDAHQVGNLGFIVEWAIG